MKEPMTARGSTAYAEARARIDAVLEARSFTIAYQPVVDIERGTVIGVEALSRFSSAPDRTPDRWFEEAWSVGLGLELELLAIDMALEKLVELPVDVYVAVNTDPRTLVAPELTRLLFATGSPDRIVLELTEHAAVEDYEALNAALAPLRVVGVRLAIDDAGAGFASLQHVLKLRPDIIKLDRSLTQNIEDNPVRGALTAGLVSFAASLNATVCAEGVETERQLVALQRGGVGTAQGFFLARPGPLPLPGLPMGIWASRPSGTAPRTSAFAARSLHARPRLDATQNLLPGIDDAALDRLARLATRALGAVGGHVTLLGDRRNFFESTFALGQHVVATRIPLAIENTREHPVAQERGVAHDEELGAYLGVPLVTAGDHVVGSVCVYGPEPRGWTEAETETMHDIARMAVDLVESRHAIRTYQEREATNRLLFIQSATASAHVDLDGVFRVANRRFTKMLGYPDDGLDGTMANLIVESTELEAIVEMHRTVLVGDVAEAELSTRLVHIDGHLIAATIRWMIVRNIAGAVQYSVVTILDDAHAI